MAATCGRWRPTDCLAICSCHRPQPHWPQCHKNWNCSLDYSTHIEGSKPTEINLNCLKCIKEDMKILLKHLNWVGFWGPTRPKTDHICWICTWLPPPVPCGLPSIKVGSNSASASNCIFLPALPPPAACQSVRLLRSTTSLSGASGVSLSKKGVRDVGSLYHMKIVALICCVGALKPLCPWKVFCLSCSWKRLVK